jgi:hypothetical protein
VAAVLRGDRPEVSAALADILTATSNALKTFAAGGTPPEPSGPAAEPAPDEPEAEPPPDVQRIELA